LEDIVEAGPAPLEDRRPKGTSRVDDDLSVLVGGDVDQLGICVRGVVDFAEILEDDLGEDALAASDHHQVLRRVAVDRVPVGFGIVKQEFGSVGIQPSGGQGMLDP
jgi:hypothetical protein